MLDVTKNAWVVEPMDETWALDVVLEWPEPNFNSNKE